MPTSDNRRLASRAPLPAHFHATNAVIRIECMHLPLGSINCASRDRADRKARAALGVPQKSATGNQTAFEAMMIVGLAFIDCARCAAKATANRKIAIILRVRLAGRHKRFWCDDSVEQRRSSHSFFSRSSFYICALPTSLRCCSR